jgi:hypothetical protein
MNLDSSRFVRGDSVYPGFDAGSGGEMLVAEGGVLRLKAPFDPSMTESPGSGESKLSFAENDCSEDLC